MSNTESDATVLPSADLPSPAPSITETDAGPLPPPYGMPSPPVTPPPPRITPNTSNGITLTISHPISISGNHNDINIAIPLESSLKHVLSSFTHSTRQTNNKTPTTSAGPGGLQIMVHCPISIMGDCNTVTMESEGSEINEMVYVPVPVHHYHHHHSQRSAHTPPSRSNASQTAHASRQHPVPSTSSLPQLSVPQMSPGPETRKRKIDPNLSVPIDTAPFTAVKRQRTDCLVEGTPEQDDLPKN